MIDREKVLNGLEACADRTGALCRTCPYDFRKEGCISDMAEDALELLKEQEEQKFFVDSDGKITPLPIQPHWISVKDRLPEVGNVVLAFGTRSATTGMFQGVSNSKRNDLWWWKGHTIKHVSHWMPLPEPPEVKQND